MDFAGVFVSVLLPVAIILDILVAIYLFRVGQRGQVWASEVIEDWKNGTLLDNLVTKDEEGQILIDERLGVLIDALGSRMVQSVKMAGLQALGATAKLDKGLKQAFTKDMIEDRIPLLGLASDVGEEIFGVNVKKYITKNPDALVQLLGMPQVQGILGALGQRNNGPKQGQGSVPSMT